MNESIVAGSAAYEMPYAAADVPCIGTLNFGCPRGGVVVSLVVLRHRLPRFDARLPLEIGEPRARAERERQHDAATAARARRSQRYAYRV